MRRTGLLLSTVLLLLLLGALSAVSCAPTTPPSTTAPTPTPTTPPTTAPSDPSLQEVRWVMQAKLSGVDPRIAKAKLWFEQRVSEMTNGAFTISVEDPGAIVGATLEWGALQDGSLDGIISTEVDNRAAFGVVAGLFCEYPASPGPDQMVAWYMQGNGLTLAQELIDKTAGFNKVRAMGLVASAGAEVELVTNVLIEGVSDLDGLKIRTFGDFGQLLSRFSNAAVVSLPGGEVYEALQRGVIDAAELSDRMVNLNFGLHEVTDYWYSPCIHAPMATLGCYVNTDSWNALPAAYQRVFMTALQACLIDNVTENVSGNAEATLRLRTMEYPKLMRTPDALLEWLVEHAFILHGEYGQKDPFYAKVFEDQQLFADKYSMVRGEMQADIGGIKQKLGIS